MKIQLTRQKAQNILKLYRNTLQSKILLTLRSLASLIRKLQATLPAISLAPLQVRALQKDLIEAYLASTDEVRRSNSSVYDFDRGVKMVGQQRDITPRLHSKTRKPRYGDIHRYLIEQGVGCILGRGISTGECGKRGPSHKRVRVKGSGNSTENIAQGKEPQTRTYLYGQHDSGV